MVTVFPDMCLVLVGQFPRKYISSTASALPALIVLRILANLLELVSEKILGFYFLFSQFPKKKFSTFFLKSVIYLVVPEVLLHFRRFNP